MVTMVSDPIADFLIRIKNGYLARKSRVEGPWSRNLEGIGRILVANGYLKTVKVTKNKFKKLVLTLKYEKGRPALTDLRRVSKPGVRRYVKASQIPYVLNGLGIAVISTSQGLMTDREARKKNLGGEVLAEIW